MWVRPGGFPGAKASRKSFKGEKTFELGFKPRVRPNQYSPEGRALEAKGVTYKSTGSEQSLRKTHVPLARRMCCGKRGVASAGGGR